MPASLKRTQTGARFIKALSSTQLSALVRGGRAPTGICPARARECHNPLEGRSGSKRVLSANSSRRRSKCMRRHQHCEAETVIERASKRRGKARHEIDAAPGPHGHNLRVHCAVVRPMPAAARRQACVLAAIDKGRQRSHREEQDQKNGTDAPHLQIMLADAVRRRSAVTRK